VARGTSLWLVASIVLGVGAVEAKPAPSPPPKKAPPPVFSVKELSLRTRASPGHPAIERRVRIGLPKGWTGELEPDARSLRFFGPEGEGRILVAAALHPSELGSYLSELKNGHPAATPSPPMAMEVPGIKGMGQRATRFVITGREVGEMVLLEKANTIVLVATIVEPDAWPELEKLMQKAYTTVEIVDVPPP
jgi:hypothetical protein